MGVGPVFQFFVASGGGLLEQTGMLRWRFYSMLGSCMVAMGMLLNSSPDTLQAGIRYPAATRGGQMDDYHGRQVADPYRWLEDADAPETRTWIEAENRVTFDYLGRIPQRSKIKERLTQLWNYERYGAPFKRGDRYFISKNDGLQNQSVLYTLDSLNGTPKVLLDPNKLSADGTVALSSYAVNEEGTLLAYGVSKSGSDWQEWRVRDVRTGQDLSDLVEWVKFSGVSWTKDGKGFFYSRYDKPSEADMLRKANYFHKLYFHRIGQPQAQDELVYERPDHKEWMFDGEVTEDGTYLVITIRIGTDPRNRVYYRDLSNPASTVVPLLDDYDASYDLVGSEGRRFWFLTDHAAPKRRLVEVDLGQPDKSHWKPLIAERPETLTGISVVADQFLASYLQDAHSVVRRHRLDGSLIGDVALPGLGTVAGLGGRRSDRETFYSFTGFTMPGAIYRLDLEKAASTVYREPKLAFTPSDFETRQVFYTSKDGTRIPMFLSYRKGLVLNGNNPTLLYGYGGFNISLTPAFSVAALAWMEMGGIYAVPNLRGGGEYGKEWHEAGTKHRKQNVFDDFISAAEWLIRERYTKSSRLAIEGRSNGGLLVGACMTQRPDLFRAALPGVGVMDMLRFHKFTIGWAWVSDYGSAENPEEFKSLIAYSPLHNLRSGVRYPATLVTTGDHDDRVVPAHSFKFAAQLQYAHKGTRPVLIRIDTKAGHGAGKPTAKLIEEWADKWAFLAQELNVR